MTVAVVGAQKTVVVFETQKTIAVGSIVVMVSPTRLDFFLGARLPFFPRP